MLSRADLDFRMFPRRDEGKVLSSVHGEAGASYLTRASWMVLGFYFRSGPLLVIQPLFFSDKFS